MITQHIRPDILAMPETTYTLSTLADASARQGIPVHRLIKLDGNENLYGPSPKVAEALAGQWWNFYPDLSHQDLNRALAAYAGVDPAQVVATNGGDELILLLAQMALQPGDQIIDCMPTFSFYDWSARVQGGQTIVVPRRREEDFALDTPAILRALTSRTRLIFVCNPNNPTGGLTPQADIETLLQTGCFVAVDETYREFAGVTMLPLLERYPNLIIMRSLSKWAALAGLRVGYGILSAQAAAHLRKLRQPFNVNQAGYIAALASLDDAPYLHANVARLVEERQRLFARLQEFPFIHCYPSHGNFILCEMQSGLARQLRDIMESEGVLVRLFQNAYLPNAIRISVGKPEHTEAVVTALQEAGQRLDLL